MCLPWLARGDRSSASMVLRPEEYVAVKRPDETSIIDLRQVQWNAPMS